MILDKILAHKKQEVVEAEAKMPFDTLQKKVSEQSNPPSVGRFRAALVENDEVSLIAEVKKASPSKGVIRPDFDPVQLALAYEENGASAISVLTDRRFFQGSLEHLVVVRRASRLPILRKEFIIDPYQIYEARLYGADAILLIAAALAPNLLKGFMELANILGLDALVEVHTKEELKVAVDAGATLIGINNRDLTTFETTLDVTRHLIELIPPGIVIVSESGIHSREDVLTLGERVDAVLVGEALAKEADPGAKVRALLGRAPSSTKTHAAIEAETKRA